MGRVCEGRKTIPACWVDFGSEKEKGKNGWRRGSVTSEGKEEDNMKTGRLRERERNRRKNTHILVPVNRIQCRKNVSGKEKVKGSLK